MCFHCDFFVCLFGIFLFYFFKNQPKILLLMKGRPSLQSAVFPPPLLCWRWRGCAAGWASHVWSRWGPSSVWCDRWPDAAHPVALLCPSQEEGWVPAQSDGSQLGTRLDSQFWHCCVLDWSQLVVKPYPNKTWLILCLIVCPFGADMN